MVRNHAAFRIDGVGAKIGFVPQDSLLVVGRPLHFLRLRALTGEHRFSAAGARKLPGDVKGHSRRDC